MNAINNKGFSIIEVLVSLVIFSIVIASYLKFYLNFIENNKDTKKLFIKQKEFADPSPHQLQLWQCQLKSSWSKALLLCSLNNNQDLIVVFIK